MAKPIKEPRVLSGKAAEEFANYLAKARPDPKKKSKLESDREVHEKIGKS